MAKSTHAGSLAVLDFVTQHACGGAPGRVHAVRGNHDQMVVQWRAWRDWFAALHLDPTAAPAPWVPALAPARRALSRSRADPEKKDPPVHSGRAFLALIEREWARAQREDPKGAGDPDEWADTARKRAAGTWRAAWWRRIPRAGKGRHSKDWALFSDHYWIARCVFCVCWCWVAGARACARGGDMC